MPRADTFRGWLGSVARKHVKTCVAHAASHMYEVLKREATADITGPADDISTVAVYIHGLTPISRMQILTIKSEGSSRSREVSQSQSVRSTLTPENIITAKCSKRCSPYQTYAGTLCLLVI